MKSYIFPIAIGAAFIAIVTLTITLVSPTTSVLDDPARAPDDRVSAQNDTNQATVSASNISASDNSDAESDSYRLVIDIARVQADGMAVFAGRGAPNATIFITENGQIFAQNVADESGQWVVLPDEPLAPGTHLLQLEMVTKEGVIERADVSLVVEIAENGDQKPLVALVPQSDDQSPTLLQSPDDKQVAAESDETNDATDKPVTQAEQVAEILGQEDIFIQIGSLSWGDNRELSVHGVASGGHKISGIMADQKLQDVILKKTGRWSSTITGNPFLTGDRQRLDITLHDKNDKSIATTSLSVAQSQLTAGLDGSLMVVVHKGDMLWRIAYRSYGEGVRYVDIFRRNADKIDDPDLIYPNQIFAVPGVKDNE